MRSRPFNNTINIIVQSGMIYACILKRQTVSHVEDRDIASKQQK